MSIETLDPQIASLITQEEHRQHHTLDMIASENYAPLAVRQATGSVLTNKYAEGYAHRRYYGGCEVVDQVEELAIERVKSLFDCEYANVQPHSGSTANAAVYSAFLQPGDTLMGLDLAHGGHLTHGMPLNFSGKLYNIVTYGVDERTQRIDMNKVREIARANKPKMIVAGWSAYSRVLDFETFRSIADEVGAYLLVDMAHFAGLVAAGLHPNPFPYADVVTSTTHKTLCGPRGGLILSHSKYARKLDSSVFPGHQGGPSMHTIAGKAVAFHLAGQSEFVERQKRTVEGAQIIAQRFLTESTGRIDLLTGGTDVHLVLLDLRGHFLNGLQAEQRLQEIGIITNRNAIPFDPRPPKITSGLRIGTPALATRGFGTDEFTEVADIIVRALNEKSHEHNLTQRVKNLAEDFPLA